MDRIAAAVSYGLNVRRLTTPSRPTHDVELCGPNEQPGEGRISLGPQHDRDGKSHDLPEIANQAEFDHTLTNNAPASSKKTARVRPKTANTPVEALVRTIAQVKP